MSFARVRAGLAAMVAAAAVFVAGPSDAARRALVIGNDAYQHFTRLERAVADARSYREQLEARGFEVYHALNADRTETFRLVFQFLNAIRPGDTAVVVYSGHGVQLDPDRRDTLFLLPTDVPDLDPGIGAEEAFLDAHGLSFSKVSEWVRERGAKLSVFVLDACRNNPFTARPGTRSIGISRGLGRIEAGEGEFVFFAAAPGREALDRLPEDDASTTNSVFTRVFLRHFRRGVYLEDVANNVQAEVLEISRRIGQPQAPYYTDGVAGKACIDDQCGAEGAAGPVLGSGARPGRDSGPSARQIEETFWRLCETKTLAGYCEAYLETFPDSPRARLARLRLEEIGGRASGGAPPTAGAPSGANVAQASGAPEPDRGLTLYDPAGEAELGGRVPGPIATVDPDALEAAPGVDREAAKRLEAAALRAEAWRALGATEDTALLRRFIEAYPGTPEARQASARIDRLEAARADAERAAREEAAALRAEAWRALGATEDTALLRRFIEAYPGTQEATQARARIVHLEAARLEAARLEAASRAEAERLAAIDRETEAARLQEAAREAARLEAERGLNRDGQRELNRLGYGAGPVDGIWGPRSRAALRRFQADQKIARTGLMTDAVLDRLKKASPAQRRTARRRTEPAPATPPASTAAPASGEPAAVGSDATEAASRPDTAPDTESDPEPAPEPEPEAEPRRVWQPFGTNRLTHQGGDPVRLDNGSPVTFGD